MERMDKQLLAAARRDVRPRPLDAYRARTGSSAILTADESARAAKLSREDVDSLVQRSDVERAPSEFRSDRQRAAMVFFSAWEEIRRAIHCLRWYEGDAAALAPSLFTTADRRGREAGEAGEEGDAGGGSAGGGAGEDSERKAEPADPLPADKREELGGNDAFTNLRVPQDDPFIR